MVMPFADVEVLVWEQIRGKSRLQSQVRNVRNSKRRYERSLKPHPIMLLILSNNMEITE